MTGPLAEVTTEVRDGVTIAVVSGEVDLSNAGWLHESVAAAVGDARAVDVDLQGVSYLDTSGIRVLTELAARPGVRWRFVARPGGVAREVLRVAGLVGPLDVVDER